MCGNGSKGIVKLQSRQTGRHRKSSGQGRTDNSWGPRAIGDHGAPVSLPKLKKAYEKGTRGISWGPLLTPGPRAVPEFPNGQSAHASGNGMY
ncbi:unnamed protein product [Staurois parvus]|uniref:Uncharacterized protein n=1 Tax=Staurois parvus TaxID=386267 RepID=A0ABN9CW92_9NEOB|nr:unnamed protein product [Staurois parvus]